MPRIPRAFDPRHGLLLAAMLAAGCSTVVPSPAGEVVIEHPAMRHRPQVYDAAQKACLARGGKQAVFVSQHNVDMGKPPLTGAQRSLFTCS